MTAARIIYLFCDAKPAVDDCLGRSGSNDLGADSLFDTNAEARKAAQVHGWHSRPGGRDICPWCWAAGAR